MTAGRRATEQPATPASQAPGGAAGDSRTSESGPDRTDAAAAHTETRKEISVAIDDGIHLNTILIGEVSLADERQAMSDLAALLRRAAESVEAERDREFPDEETDHA